MGLLVLGADDLSKLMARLSEDGALKEGAAHVLAFDAIRDKTRRWALRQDSVREFIERTFHRTFPASDTLVPLDDVNYLVIQPLETGYAAQGRALRFMAEVLQFFLGSSARADLRLSRVTRIGPDGVETEPVDIKDADLREAEKDKADDNPSDPQGEGGLGQSEADSLIDGQGLLTPIEASAKGASPAVHGDRTYDAMFVIEPIWSIRQEAVVSYHLRPLIFEYSSEGLVPADLRKATLRDLLRLDLIVLAEAEKVLGAQEAGSRIALHVPVHQAVLAMTSARHKLLGALDRMNALSSSLIIVLTGLEIGTPHSRLVEATSLLLNRCRAVVALAPSFDCPIDRWRDARLSGIAIELCNPLDPDGSPSLSQIAGFAARLDRAAPALIAYSAPKTALTLAAWSAGFTHVGGDVIFKGRNEGLKPARVKAIDIYRQS